MKRPWTPGETWGLCQKIVTGMSKLEKVAANVEIDPMTVEKSVLIPVALSAILKFLLGPPPPRGVPGEGPDSHLLTQIVVWVGPGPDPGGLICS